MIRVAYVVDHLEMGGAQRHLLEVVRGLSGRGYGLEIWTAAAKPGVLASAFEGAGVPVRSFGIDTTMLRPATLAAVARVARELRQRGVHVVHGYLFEGNLLATLVGRLGRVPVTLVSKRSLDRYARLDRRIAAWASNRLADRVLVNAVAVGQVVAEHEWCSPRRMTVIRNGVALPSQLDGAVAHLETPDPRGDGPLVGMVGRLSWKKGYEFALAAAARLHERIPALRFDVVGDGPLREDLERAAASLGLRDTVRFLGERRDAPDLMRTFDCYVLSSVIEGMPNALLEAMALGRPVVTTSAGGSAEVVVDGESGLVVPPGDAEALADAVLRVLVDPALAARLGAAGQRRAREHFSLEAMLGALDSLYRSRLSRAGIATPPAAHAPSGPLPDLGAASSLG